MRLWPLVLTFLLSGILHAQKADSTSKRLKVVPLPALFYTPETRLGFGGVLSGVLQTGDPVATRKSNLQVVAAYTLNSQIILESKHLIFSDKEKYLFSGELNFYDFPIFYYGVGNKTVAENEENLEYKVFVFRQRGMKKIGSHSFLGVQYRFNHVYDIGYEPDVLNDRADVLNQSGTNSGAGLAFLYDSRDNVMNSFKGKYFEASMFSHGSALGSDYSFTKVSLDYRKYWQLKNQDIVAVQGFSELNFGDVMFRELARMGGDKVMRGYYRGRFRDKNQLVGQIEYRKQLISWIGLTGFAAFGDVSDNVGNFDISNFKYAVGGGLRIMVNKADRLNIRIDYGIGKGVSGLYFGFAEAF